MTAFLMLAILVVLILGFLGLIGLLSTICERLKVIGGALSMIAVAIDEQDDPKFYGPDPGRKIMREISNAIYNGISNAMNNQQRH